MNILKSSDKKFTTFKKIKNFDGVYYSLWLFLCMCKNFMKNLSLNVVVFTPFVGIT
jgi:hypothetical protein